MQGNAYVVAIVTGDGLVARFGDVTMFVADTGASAAPLLDVIEHVAAATDPAAALIERLAPLVLRASSSVPPFAAVAPTDEGLLVLLRGAVTADIEASDGSRQLTAQRAKTWVDEIQPWPVHRVVIQRADAPVPGVAQPHTDLRTGVVSGGGFSLRPYDSAAGAPGQAQTESPATVVEVRAVDEPTTVIGRDHQGTSSSTPNPTATMQGAAAALTTEDGAVYPLDRSYVVGRDPLLDDAVSNAQATPLVLQGDPRISRIHAYIAVEGRTVRVRDAATVSGTFIAAPGAADWTQIGSDATELPAGWSLRVGERILTYQGSLSS